LKGSRLRIFVALFLLAIAIMPILTLFVSADSKYDYSYPSANFKEEVFPDEFLLENITGLTLTEEEKAFLRNDLGALVKYNSSIPSYTVTTEYKDGGLDVVCEKYDYVAENGTIVVWKPYEAELCGAVTRFDGAPYITRFENVDENETEKLTVRYGAEFVISAETVNELLSYSYKNALLLKEHIINKREEYEKYILDLDKYNEYLAALALYNDYLSKYKVYTEKQAAYTEYLSELKEYEEQTALYRDYVIARDKYYMDLAKYTEYLAYAEQNQAKIDAYETYQEKYQTMRYQLDIIKRTKTPISVENAPDRTVYGAIMGDTVTTVIDRKGDIVNVLKADGAVVDLAGRATENLRVLMTEFFEIKNVEAQYKYYITNYEAFKENFTDLLRALENLYCVSGVRGTMIEQDKYEKYIVLVAQLYYIANALSDSPIASLDGSFYYDENFVIGMTYNEDYKRISPSAALEGQYFLEDKDIAEPLADGYPIEPEKPDFLTVVEPVMPDPVAKPIPPDEVLEPTPPVPVSKPREVSKPSRVEEYTPDETTAALILALDEGRLLPHKPYTGKSITLFKSVSVLKSVSPAETVTVTYYDKEYSAGEQGYVLYSVTVDRGSAADYLGVIPEKAEDANFVYAHCGWTDADGVPLDLSAVLASVDAYPMFEATAQLYDTYWVVGDGTVFDDYPGIPELPAADYYEYDYGFGEPVLDFTAGTKTFYASYLTDRPLVTMDFGTLKVYYDGNNFSFSQGRGTDSVNVSNLLERAAGVAGITMRTSSGATVSFSTSEVMELRRAGVQKLTFKNDKRIMLLLLDEDGEPVDAAVSYLCNAPVSSSDPSHIAVSYTENGERIAVRHKLSQDSESVSFNALSGIQYTVRTEYSLSAPPLLDGVVINLSRSVAETGETVGVNVYAPDGISIERVYLKNSSGSGEELTIVNSSFVMPSYDVIVCVEYKKLTYTVKFISDGRTLISKTYTYGDTVSVPDDPSKASDESFSYVFKGWSPSVSPTVTGNATYSAVYEAVPLPEKNLDNDKMTPTVLRLYLLLIVGTVCLTFIVIPSSVINFVIKARRKKQVFKVNK